MPLNDVQRRKLRRIIAEPTVETFSDADLDSIFDDNSGDLAAAAAEVWENKAAEAAGLVDVSEGPSSRKMSQIATQYQTLAAHYRGQTSTGSGSTSRAATTRPIERV